MAVPAAALDVDELLGLALGADGASSDDDPQGELNAAEILELSGNLARGRRSKATQKRAAFRRRGLQEKQLNAQIHTFNRLGLAKTRDHHMRPMGGGKRKNLKVPGSAGWKRWSPEAILKSASTPATSTCRAMKAQGASPASALQTRAIKANAIVDAQDAGLAALVQQSRKRKLRFCINNNMYDETKLPFGKPTCRKRRCLAWHGQVTWSAEAGHVEDVDVVRAPRIMGRYTAATLWNLMAKGSDIAGLYPIGDALPVADYHATLTASDTHSVNVLFSKQLAAVLPPTHFTVSALCMQHRTGAVCEELSKPWALMPSSFCLATQLQHGDFHDDLTETVRAVLTKYLDIDEVFDDDELDDEGLRLCEFAAAILEDCHVASTSTNAEEDGDPAPGEEKRRKEAERFRAFFPPPWKGVLRHRCRAGCCGPTPCHDRLTSINTGTDLIMLVIFPHMTIPAANRYTKAFPVICRVGLMLQFHSLFKKAMRKLLLGRADNSDDDAVLNDANALVGAPADPIAHQRKLQASKTSA